MRIVAKSIVVVLLALIPSQVPSARQAAKTDFRAAIDQAVAEILEKTGAPSASVAVVVDGKIAYERAYGTVPRAQAVL